MLKREARSQRRCIKQCESSASASPKGVEKVVLAGKERIRSHGGIQLLRCIPG